MDVRVVRFLIACEAEGIQLLHCAPYIREWMSGERRRGCADYMAEKETKTRTEGEQAAASTALDEHRTNRGTDISHSALVPGTNHHDSPELLRVARCEFAVSVSATKNDEPVYLAGCGPPNHFPLRYLQNAACDFMATTLLVMRPIGIGPFDLLSPGAAAEGFSIARSDKP